MYVDLLPPVQRKDYRPRKVDEGKKVVCEESQNFELMTGSKQKRGSSDARISKLSTGCDRSEQYFVEEAVHVVKCTLLLGTCLFSRRAGSMPAPRLCKRRISI